MSLHSHLLVHTMMKRNGMTTMYSHIRDMCSKFTAHNSSVLTMTLRQYIISCILQTRKMRKGESKSSA